MPKPHPRSIAARALHGEGLRLEEERPALLELKRDEVLAHLGLGVDHHGPPTGQSGKVDPVPPPVEPQLDAVVPQPLTVHALTGTRGPQHVHGPLLQDPGPLPMLHICPVPALQHDGVDPRVVQQPRQQQPGRSGPDDPDGGTHRLAPSRYDNRSERHPQRSPSETNFTI